MSTPLIQMFRIHCSVGKDSKSVLSVTAASAAPTFLFWWFKIPFCKKWTLLAITRIRTLEPELTVRIIEIAIGFAMYNFC